MEYVEAYVVSSSKIKQAMEIIEMRQGKGHPISLMYMLKTFFPMAVKNLNENFSQQFTLGYIEGRKDAKRGY